MTLPPFTEPPRHAVRHPQPCGARVDCDETATVAFEMQSAGRSWSSYFISRCARHAPGIRDGKTRYVIGRSRLPNHGGPA